jgi:hypothetical protein
MPTNIRQSAREHDESDAARAWPGSRAQDLEYGERRSIGRRLFRAVFRFIVAVLIGVGLTLAWQSYGDKAVNIARFYAPSVAWLLPIPETKTAADNQMFTATIATEVKQQLEPIALKVDVVQHSIVQLTAKINELATNQVTHNMQTVGEHVSPKMSPVPPDTNAAQAPKLETKPDKPNATASVGVPSNASNIAAPDQPASNRCNIDACKEAYFTFNPADCTYQPSKGPRRLCTK